MNGKTQTEYKSPLLSQLPTSERTSISDVRGRQGHLLNFGANREQCWSACGSRLRENERRLRRLDMVAAFRLRTIERFVGCDHQPVEVVVPLGRHRHPYPYCRAMRSIRDIERGCGKPSPDSFGHLQRVREGYARKQDGKFLATEPADQVTRAHV